MTMWQGSWSGVEWALMGVGMLMFWAALVAGILWLTRATDARSPDERDELGRLSAYDILDGRYAQGELSDDDDRGRRDSLTTR